MKITVPIEKRLFGTITIDVPEGSPLLDETASLLKKRKAAKKLATEKFRESGENCVEWTDFDESTDYVIDTWFTINEEEESHET